MDQSNNNAAGTTALFGGIGAIVSFVGFMWRAFRSPRPPILEPSCEDQLRREISELRGDLVALSRKFRDHVEFDYPEAQRRLGRIENALQDLRNDWRRRPESSD